MIKLTEIVGYPDLEWHINNNRRLTENVYRYSSKSFLKLFEEARRALNEGLISLCEEDEELIRETDIGLYGMYQGKKVPLDLPFEDELLNEAEYQGKDVELNKPKRGGSKKYYVYTRNPKTGKVIKVSFGAAGGGQNLAVKLDDPKRRKAFSDRHNCPAKKDKTKPSYWSCRLPRFTRILGMSLAPSNTFW
jgi:hypothetical protein